MMTNGVRKLHTAGAVVAFGVFVAGLVAVALAALRAVGYEWSEPAAQVGGWKLAAAGAGAAVIGLVAGWWNLVRLETDNTPEGGG